MNRLLPSGGCVALLVILAIAFNIVGMVLPIWMDYSLFERSSQAYINCELFSVITYFWIISGYFVHVVCGVYVQYKACYMLDIWVIISIRLDGYTLIFIIIVEVYQPLQYSPVCVCVRVFACVCVCVYI